MISLTLTGVDEWSDPGYLAQLGPYVEFGFLFSMNNRGKRYASLGRILNLMTRAQITRASLHICGDEARRIVKKGGIHYLVDEAFQRIQLNGILDREYVETVCSGYPNHTIVTQHRAGNEDLFGIEAPNHALLVDESAGTGKLFDSWEKLSTHKTVGFAGGLTPANLPELLPRFAEIAGPGCWIDIESGVRNADDKFDVGLAYEAIKAVVEFNERA